MQLFTSWEKCCGCGACENICPVDAISMTENQYGFIYPSVDKTKCIECGKCETVCQYKRTDLSVHKTVNVYAAVSANDGLTKYSCSAGVFATMAEWILNKNGVVCGAILDKAENKGRIEAGHIFIENVKDLCRLQGSKYVQSNINDCYQKCEKYLKNGRTVLFSGTPCQIAGLKLFLGKEYSGLITVDIVCHGVPGQKFFQSYLSELEKKHGEIDSFRFRFKPWEKDAGHNAQYISYKNGRRVLHSESGYCSSYYKLFLDGVTCRESCYECRWARKGFERTGDVTICDYWGFRKVHPEIVKNNSLFRSGRRVSGILINSVKGAFVKEIGNGLILMESSEEKLKKYNPALRNPVSCPENRKKYFDLYMKAGYGAVEREFRRQEKFVYYLRRIFFRLPPAIKAIVRKRYG